MKLNIPHQTQQNNKHFGDCGPAAVQMLTAAVTIEDAINACGLSSGEWAKFYNLQKGLAFYDIDSHYSRLKVPYIRNYLSVRWPIIVLIGYNRLPQMLKRSSYNSAHYVLAVGYDAENVLIHDPLGSEKTGSFIPCPDDVLSYAMRDVPKNSYDNQCLVVQKQFPKQRKIFTYTKRIFTPL